jgi:hypothetical protein
MNAKLSSSSLLLTALLCLGLGSVQAQDPSVPSYINYQGSVTDSTGNPLGATNATPPLPAPINRKVIFRIYDSATGANLLWTEEQTVTISLGQFSVLLGRGIQFESEDHDDLESVFTSNDGGGPEGPQRYLGITVDDGNNILDASDVPISPRQQITTTAYSFRAGTADSVASGSSLVLNNSADYGLGYFGTGRTFNNTPIDGPVLYGLSGGALGSVTGVTQKTALRWNNNSQVGIGTSTLNNAAAATKLVVQGDSDSLQPVQLSIRGESDNYQQLLMGYNTRDNYGMISSYNGINNPSPLYLNRTGGAVILGNSTSSTNAFGGFLTPLGYRANAGYSFDGDEDTGMYRTSSDNLGFYTRNQLGMKIDHFGRMFPQNGVFAPVSFGGTSGYSFDGDSDTGMYRPIANQLSFHSNGIERMRLDASGNVGIGTTVPQAKLDVHGATVGIQISNTAETWAGITFEDFQANQTNDLQQAAIKFDSSLNDLGFFNGSLTTPKMVIQEDGKVGIGTVDPTADLHINQSSASTNGTNGMRLQNNSSNWNIYHSGAHCSFAESLDSGSTWTRRAYIASSTGAYNQQSDLRLKKNIEAVGPILDDVEKLRPVQYHFKSQEDSARKSTGFIAQEVEKIFPNLVNTGEDGMKGLSYAEFSVLAIAAVSELREEKDAQLKERDDKIADLEARLARLEAMMTAE